MTFDRSLTVALGAIIAVGLGLSYAPLAQNPTAAPAGDPQRGSTIAANGTAGGAPGCAQCHGQDGAADPSGSFPRIAGQSDFYLAKQLREFASVVRSNDTMSPIAKAMTAQDIADVAAYYAASKAPVPPLPTPDAAVVKAGRELAKMGNEAKGFQACDNCHGPDGAGEPPVVPYLAGQFADYITQQFQAWQGGTRRNSPTEMAVVAKKLSAQDIAAVAAYYQQVRTAGEVVGSK
jgi:cytochrome c553